MRMGRVRLPGAELNGEKRTSSSGIAIDSGLLPSTLNNQLNRLRLRQREIMLKPRRCDLTRHHLLGNCRPAPATFSLRCSADDVPGMSMNVGRTLPRPRRAPRLPLGLASQAGMATPRSVLSGLHGGEKATEWESSGT